MKIMNKLILNLIFFIILFNCTANVWSQYYIKGSVSYSDNGEPLINDKVFILYYNYDLSTSVYLDSADLDQSGNYLIRTLYNDSVLVCVGYREIIQSEDHVQTFYPSTVDWQQAQKIYPHDNPANINIAVSRIIPQSGSSMISGTITTVDSNNNIIPLSGATIIAQQNTTYRNAMITDFNGNYTLDSLSNGTFTILATKIGYSMDSTTITTNGNSINSNHPKLKLNKVIKIHNILTSRVSNKLNLYQNYPNPFNPSTKIKFSVSFLPLTKGEANLPAVRSQAGGFVRLTIFDILGREVTTLINETLQPGTYEIKWDASKYSSGIYFYELVLGNYKNVKKMLLIK